MTFLGHQVSKEGVTPDESKVRVVMDWPVPRTVKKL